MEGERLRMEGESQRMGGLPVLLGEAFGVLD
jgi:hypothetical protein